MALAEPVAMSVAIDTWVRVGARRATCRCSRAAASRVGGRRIAVFRLPDGWAAIDAACPHLGGPLGDGLVAERCVTCPLHGRRFDLVTGEQHGGDDVVAVHEVAERDGALWVRLA